VGLAAPNLADLEVAKRNQVSREGAAMTETTPSPLNNVITIDDDRIKNHLDRVVRGSVEEPLNALLDAGRIGCATPSVTSAARPDAILAPANLQTKAGEVRLKRRESSVDEALIEMYLAGVSVRRVEDITEALWGTRVSPSTVSDLNRKIYGTIEPIEGEQSIGTASCSRAAGLARCATCHF
jgi:putative transposase